MSDEIIKDHEHRIRYLEIIKDHEHRIRYLEGRMWLIFGGLALLAAEIPIALKFFR